MSSSPEDFLDDKHWVNVQDPIKQMFLSLSKAIRVQGAGLRELDRKSSDYITTDVLKRFLKEQNELHCSKQDATQIIYQLDTKTNEKDFHSLENKVNQMAMQMERMSQQFQDQQQRIIELEDQNVLLQNEIRKLQKPNYDPVFDFLSKQLKAYNEDVTTKLSLKADKLETETIIPKKLEDLYMTIQERLTTMKYEILEQASLQFSKDHLNSILQSKVDRKEFLDFTSTYQERFQSKQASSSHEINSQLKPILIGLSSLEKAIQIQERIHTDQLNKLSNNYDSMAKLQNEIVSSGILSLFQPTTGPFSTTTTSPLTALPLTVNSHFSKYLSLIVEDTIHQLFSHPSESHNRLHSLLMTKNQVENMIQQTQEYLLKQSNMTTESMRLEITTIQREEMELFKHSATNKFQEFATAINELNEKNMKNKKSLKELSLNVAKSLSKKLDIKDFKTIVLKNQNKMTTTGTTGQEEIIHQSRELLRDSPIHRSRKESNEEKDDGLGGVYYSSGSDPIREFDFLINSMKKDRLQQQHASSSEEQFFEEEIPVNRGAGGSLSPTRSGSSHVHRHHRTPSSLSPSGRRSLSAGKPLSASRLSSRSGDDFGSGEKRRSGGANNSQNISTSRLSQSFQQKDLETSRGNNNNNLSMVLLKNEIQLLKENYQTLLEKDIKEMKNQQIILSDALSSLTQNNNNTVSFQNTKNKLSNASIGPISALLTSSDDWRIAIGEIALNLRRELAEKASREELYSLVRTENSSVDNRLSTLEKGNDKFTTVNQTQKLENEIQSLRNKISLELTSARFLWTSGQLMDSSWIPWDTQIMNSVPSIILWKKNTTEITIRIPGLYRLTVAMFTQESTILQVYLNNEPIFSYHPDQLPSSQIPSGSSNQLTPATGILLPNNHTPLPLVKEKQKEHYYLERFRHSIGEVSCISIEEFISIPPEAQLSVRYYSSQLAQGFLSLQKI